MTKQILNGCQQSCSLRQRLWRALEHQALKRFFCALYVCLQVIFLCGALEAAPTPPADVRPEGFNCKQMPVAAVQDNSTGSVGTANEPKQGISERSTKCGAGNSNATRAVVSPHKMSGNGGNKQTAGDADNVLRDKVYEVFQGALFALLIAWPIIFLGNAEPYGGLKPNNRLWSDLP